MKIKLITTTCCNDIHDNNVSTLGDNDSGSETVDNPKVESKSIFGIGKKKRRKYRTNKHPIN